MCACVCVCVCMCVYVHVSMRVCVCCTCMRAYVHVCNLNQPRLFLTVIEELSLNMYYAGVCYLSFSHAFTLSSPTIHAHTLIHTVSGFQSLGVQSLKENQKQERKQQLWSLPKRILIQSAVCARKSSHQETSCSSTLKKLDMLYTSQCPALRLELVGPVTTLEERARGESDHLLLMYKTLFILLTNC